MPGESSSEKPEAAAAAAPAPGAAGAARPTPDGASSAGETAAAAEATTATGGEGTGSLLLPHILGLSKSGRRGLSPLQELERQQQRGAAGSQVEAPASSNGSSNHRRYLSFAERQRLLNSAPPPWFPMLLALGMVCFFSISLSGIEGDRELLKLLQERAEIPFTPHEAEEATPRFSFSATEAEAAAAEQDKSLLRQTQDLLAIDSADQQQELEWLEERITLSDMLLKPVDYKTLLEEAPADLLPIIKALLQRAKLLKQQQQQQRQQHLSLSGRSKAAAMLQEDLVAAAELTILYRMLLAGAANNKLTPQQQQRLQQLESVLHAVGSKRLKEEWKEAVLSSRYFPDVHDQQLYSRIITIAAAAFDDLMQCIALQQQAGSATAAGGTETERAIAAATEKQIKKHSWRLTTARLELQRLLEAAKFPQQIAEAFKTE
ncbi:hypothetical protein, conserved [Eimeria maxima]|uniref:Uncharacterized protein n=1 Tax=Eimeria maxima TaxID=5804 RepID=U6MB05_EIMMA|nr:hypothetical protein, conserved [Eimeria maxima]CDJ59649.1 hypothetical protein, conserved [Eimeria maxima]